MDISRRPRRQRLRFRCLRQAYILHCDNIRSYGDAACDIAILVDVFRQLRRILRTRRDEGIWHFSMENHASIAYLLYRDEHHGIRVFKQRITRRDLKVEDLVTRRQKTEDVV